MFKLNEHLTVYTSELIAILKALEWVNQNKPENVVILTDSLSSLQSILSGKSETRQDLLNQILYLIHTAIKSGVWLNMDWLPSHCDIGGNELADQLAKSALSRGKILNYLPTPQEIYPVIKQSIRKEWSREWGAETGFRHSLCPKLQNKVQLHSENRKNDRLYSRLRFGVNGLRGNNLFYGMADPLCPNCPNQIEDTHHFFVCCPAHSAARDALDARLDAAGYTGGRDPRGLLTLATPGAERYSISVLRGYGLQG